MTVGRESEATKSPKMPKTLKQRILHFAKNALRHTKYTLVIGAGNIESHSSKTGNFNKEALLRMRSQPVKWERGEWRDVDIGKDLGIPSLVVPQFVRGEELGFSYDLPKSLPKPKTFDRSYIQTLARRATAARAGNCQENAAVAYGWLFEKARFITNFAYISVPDHAFVVMNRADSSSLTKATKAKNWGADAVICDPWGGFVCTQPQVMAAKGTTEQILVDHRTEVDMSVADIQKWIRDHDAECHVEEWRMYMQFDPPKFF